MLFCFGKFKPFIVWFALPSHSHTLCFARQIDLNVGHDTTNNIMGTLGGVVTPRIKWESEPTTILAGCDVQVRTG
jgi:hypothetical protein